MSEAIILDRSRLEQYADCSMQGYLGTLMEAARAKEQDREVFPWELLRLREAEPGLLAEIEEFAPLGDGSEVREVGIVTHNVVQAAFEQCAERNEAGEVVAWTSEGVAEALEELLPHVRPDVQPKVIVAARHLCDMIADLHLSPILGVEHQIDMPVLPATPSRPAVIATQRLDLYGQGRTGLHVIDYKAGYKRRTNAETWDSFQAQCSAALLWAQPDYDRVDVIYFWYWESRFGTKAYAKFQRTDRHHRLPDLTQETAFRARIEEAARLFLTDNRQCRPEEDKCCWCDFIRLCPHAHVAAVEIAEDPRHFVDNLVVTKQLNDKRFKAATQWVKAHGPIEGTEVIFDAKPPSNRFTCDFRKKSEPIEDPELAGYFS